jgi:hypothetical protein
MSERRICKNNIVFLFLRIQLSVHITVFMPLQTTSDEEPYSDLGMDGIHLDPTAAELL